MTGGVPLAIKSTHSRFHFAIACALAGTFACSAPTGPGGDDGNVLGTGASNGSPDGTGGVVGAGSTQGIGGTVGVGVGGTGSGSDTGAGSSTGTGGAAEEVLGGSREEVEAACDPTLALDLGVTKLRRLTKDQLNHSLRDLFGASFVDYATVLAPDESVGPFHSNSIAPVTDLIVQQLSEVAATASADAVTMSTNFVPCDLAADTTTACASQFVESFASRAFRRPVTAEEETALVNLYVLGRDGTSPQRGLDLVLQSILQSGSFLYLADSGISGTPSAVPEAVTAHTLASRLSYFLWNSIPDASLKAAADDGSLVDEAVYSAQVARMLLDPKAQESISLFHERWLDVADLPGKEKDSGRYPQYNAGLAQEMLNDQATFVNEIILKGDGLLSTLLSSPTAYPSAVLAGVYGVAAPATAGAAVALPPEQRGGLLTQPAFLAAHARSLDSSPVHRGLAVRENVLCDTIEPPPPGVSTDLPEKTEATTTREQFAEHLASITCATCHTKMDPIGLAFEHYDAIGGWRELDGTATIDATGEVLESGEDVSGMFDGVMELSAKLAQSTSVSDCTARQWFRFALNRLESESDACSMLGLFEDFEASGGNVRTLITQIAMSDAFRNVRLTGGDSQ